VRKRKRKGNIISVEKEDDTMEAIQARVKAARQFPYLNRYWQTLVHA
jgi:hypothetical protein